MTALTSYRDYGHGTHLVIHLLNHRIDRASSSTETPCPVMTQAILYRQYILMSSWQHSLLRCPVFHLNTHRISIFIDLLIVLTSRNTWASVQRWSIQPDRDEEGSWRLGTTRLLIETIDMTAHPSYRDYGHGTHLVIHLLNHRIDRAYSPIKTPRPVMTHAILHRQYILMSSWQHSQLRCPVYHLNSKRISTIIFVDLLIILTTSRNTWESAQR